MDQLDLAKCEALAIENAARPINRIISERLDERYS